MSDDEFGFGDSAPLEEFGMNLPKPRFGKAPLVTPELVDTYRAIAVQSLVGMTTKKEVLDSQSGKLSECVAIAAEIYKHSPVPDHAYQLAALSAAFNSTVGQHERMRDAHSEMDQVNSLLKDCLQGVLRSLAGEIEKAKNEFSKLHPEHKSTHEDIFKRMTEAVAPDSKKFYDEMADKVKAILGIKK